jgi:DNA-binding response OmpR family regulator
VRLSKVIGLTNIGRALIDLSGKRVLIVEEEAFIGVTEEDALICAGCDVIGPARTFEEASRLIEGNKVDAALVDGTIHGVPAFHFADELRRRNIPFTICTAHALYRPNGVPVYPFRGAMFLDKPFWAEQIVQTLEALLQSSATGRVDSGA